MTSSQSLIQSGRRIRSVLGCTLALLLVASFGTSGTAAAGEAEDFWAAFTGGKPTLDMRLRIELGKFEELEQSEAYTLRTRLGYGTADYHGFSIYADFENTTAVATSQYYDLAGSNHRGQTPIPDPTNTEVNQAFLKYMNKDWADLKLIGGRQRIKLDDVRFVGNVAWRQNEQTFDAAYGSSSLGVDDLEFAYGYLGYIRRIWGNQDDRQPGDTRYGFSRDWRSNSHIIHASYKGMDIVQPTLFVYLLDFDNPSNSGADAIAKGQSSATYGLRLTGEPKLTDDLTLAYAVSYAYQTDYGDNPTDYGANYVWADIALKLKDIGSVSAGYEMLGSDDNTAVFGTPLATLHKFNGWADRFLNNGGPAGLQDIFVTVAPRMPWKLKMKLIYHRFLSDDQNNVLGNEFDTMLARPINQYLDLLFKSAWFKADDGAALTDIWRVAMQATIKF